MFAINLLQRTKSWKVRITLIIILFTFFILLFPFLISYWIWTKSNWSKRVRLGLIAGVWLSIALAGVISRIGQDSYQKGYKAEMDETSQFNSPLAQTTIIPSITPIPTEEPTVISTTEPTQIQTIDPSPSLIPTSEPTTLSAVIAFDKNRGNNWVAAAQAQDFIDVANKAVPGIIKDVFVELMPEDVGNKDIETYKKSVVSAFIQVKVSSSFWNSFDDGSKKDFTASWVTATKNVFSGFPHIYIKNDVRTVAEGEWSVWSGEPKITLK